MREALSGLLYQKRKDTTARVFAFARFFLGFEAYPPHQRWVLMLLPTDSRDLVLHTRFVRSGCVMM